MRVGGVDRESLATGKRGRWNKEQSLLFYLVGFRPLVWLVKFWIRRYRAIGVEHIPRTGGAFLIANHASGLDPFLIGYAMPFRILTGPGKMELFESRFWGFWLRKLGLIPLRQHVADAKAVRAMVEAYRSGRVLLVFPEGGRTETGEMQPFMHDVARLMVKLKAPVIPVGIAGAHEMLPMGTFKLKRNSPAVVIFGEPLDLARFHNTKMTDQLAEQASDFMRHEVAALVSQAYREREKL